MEDKKISKIAEKSKKIISEFSEEVKGFYQFHGIQLIGSEMPLSLVEKLH
jgi:hypothetical protein